MPRKQRGELGVQLRSRNGRVDDVVSCRLGCAYGLAAEAKAHQRAVGHDAQQIGQNHHRKEPDLDLRDAEPRVLARDDEIAGAGEAEPARQGVAVEPRDQRQAAGVHALQQRNDIVTGIGGVERERALRPRPA